MRITPVCVTAQRLARRRVQWHEPRLAELGQAYCQHARVQIDIVTLEAYRFRDTHAGRCDQPEQCVVGPSVQPVLGFPLIGETVSMEPAEELYADRWPIEN